MGILKIRQRGPQNDKNQNRSPITPTNSHAESNLDYDSDEFDVAEVGCDLALLGGQICNIPYELYTLPDLREILSLETWNLCLTEDERFSLTAYFPDLDQEMFWLTAKELLSGDDIFFGSPLDKLFQRLKGGLYSPKVAHFMKSMQFLQKRKFYHSLRSYHETMIKRFEEMRRSWIDLQANVAVQERIKIWKRKQQRPVFLVDLNAFPTDEDVPTNSYDAIELKRQDFSGTFPSLSLNKNMKAKGVLKIRPVNTTVVENQMAQRRLPKGVLKIKGKSEHLSHAETSTSYDLLQSPKFTTQWHQDKNINMLPYSHQFLRDGRESFLTSGTGVVRNAETYKRKMSPFKEMRLHSIPESPRGEILSSTTFEMLAEETGNFREYESYSFPLKHRRRRARGNAEISKAKSETTNIDGAILHTRFGSPLHGDQVIEDEKDSVNYAVSDAQRDNPAFPLTYKRKKPFARLNPMDCNKKLAPNACSEENILNSDSHAPEKSGGLRIRFKPLNDYNAYYKQGLLNELQLGSSSTQGI